MKLLLIGLGQLTGAVLDSVARDGRFAQIVLAGRNAELGRAKVLAARIGAALEGEFPRIEFVPFDFNTAAAPETLKRIAPDVAFAAPSLLPRRRIRADPKLRALPSGIWLACHLAPMLRLRDTWETSGLSAPWVGAAEPDLVNAILHLTGSGPTAGSGGIATCVPRIRFLAAQQAKAPAQEIVVRLVAGASFADCMAGEGALKEWPPFMLKVTWHGQDITLAVRDKLKAKVPLLSDLDQARIAASATLDLLAALGDDGVHDLHVPAPNGLIGGYPVKINRRGAEVDLPATWDLDQALGINATALAYDGIAALDKDGTITYTDRGIAAFQALLGERIERLRPPNAQGLADKLVAAFGG
ncbi:hypothetical protein [Dongia sedimenti]|uniref:Saccharopine dehydrogenase n=1 Tax=Dongia sedimenti TaxID=3064282 RepID=A0ABU0YN10_9PROT|nr:hypothetical protein [Rhodospirillaceae bacterium R-7]